MKIADFGLARMLPSTPGSKQTTKVVTLSYRAPEIILGLNYNEKGIFQQEKKETKSFIF